MFLYSELVHFITGFYTLAGSNREIFSKNHSALRWDHALVLDFHRKRIFTGEESDHIYIILCEHQL